MNLAEATAAINKLWIQRWPVLSAGTYSIGGVDVVLAAGVAYTLDNVTIGDVLPLAELYIIPNGSDQYTLAPLGQRKFLRSGVIQVMLHQPLNEGRKIVDGLALQVIELLESKRIARTARDGGIKTEEVNVTPLKSNKEPARRFSLLCTTAYSFTERR